MPDVGINMARDTAKPGLDSIDRLDHAGEIAPLDDLFDEAERVCCRQS